MTLALRKDQLPMTAEAFATAVQAHAAALNEYRQHLRGVEEDAANPDLTPDERRVAFPGPSAPDIVRNAVSLKKALIGGAESYVSDYYLCDPPLVEKKQALFAQVTRMENVAIEANIPAAKRRHWEFRDQDIRQANFKRYNEAPEELTFEQKGAWADARMSADDVAFLADRNARVAKETAIQRWAAKLHADIDDLTEETVDAFKIEPFSG